MQVFRSNADEIKDVFPEHSLKDNTEFDKECNTEFDKEYLHPVFDMFRKHSEGSSVYVSKLLELLFDQLENDLMKEELPDSAKSI